MEPRLLVPYHHAPRGVGKEGYRCILREVYDEADADAAVEMGDE